MTYRTFILAAGLFIFCAKAFSQAPSTDANNKYLRPDSLLNKKALNGILKVFPRPDTLSHTANNFIRKYENNVSSLGKSLINPEKQALLQQAMNLKAGLFEAGSLVKDPVIFHDGVINYGGAADTSYIKTGKESIISNMDLNSDWLLASVPVTISFQSQSWTDVNNDNLYRFSFQFDRDGYINQLKKKLFGKFDPSSLLKLDSNLIQNSIHEAQLSFDNDLQQLNSSYKGLLSNEIHQLGSFQTVLNTDIKTMREKYTNPAYVKDLAAKQNALASFQQKINNGEKVDTAQFNRLQNDVARMNGIQELLARVEKNRAKWEQSGLLKKLKEFGLLQKNSISALLKDPSAITRLARQHLSLSGLQKMFLNMSHLNIGQNAVSESPLSLQHFLSSGISAGFLMNNRMVTLLAGKQKDFNSILDYPFSSALFSNNGDARALGLGIKSGNTASTNISVSSFNQSMSGLFNALASSRLRQILVTTVSEHVSVGQKSALDLEISRSATQYTNTGTPGDSLLNNKNNLSRVFSTDNFMGNTALSLKYSDRDDEKGLAYDVSFNKAANGYTNPGNAYLASGSTELGANIKKSFLKNKLTFSFRGNDRVYKYNDELDTKWKNSYFIFDTKWKLNKGQYIAIRYQPVRMVRVDGNIKTPVTSLERISAETNLFKKINKKITYRNFLTLSRQQDIYVANASTRVSNTAIMISSFQSIMIGAKLLYVNTTYNRASNSTQYVFLNSSFFTEAGYAYVILKHISGSSGLIYNSISGWYSQAGVRQSLSGQLGQKFMISLYVDAAKSIKVIQPLWNSPVRMDLSIRYIFKKRN